MPTVEQTSNGGPCSWQTGMGFLLFPLLFQSLGSLATHLARGDVGPSTSIVAHGSSYLGQPPGPRSAKELLPVVVAAAVWGRYWAGQRVLFLSDNADVVAALASRSARHPILAHLLKCLFFWEAKFDFENSADHIPGKRNAAADALSRNNTSLFLSLFPQAASEPTPIPPSLAHLLMDHKLQWTSPSWARLFKDTLSRV